MKTRMLLMTAFLVLLFFAVALPIASAQTASTTLSSSSIIAGQSVYDTAVYSGGNPGNTNTVTFYLTTSADCTNTFATPTIVGTPFAGLPSSGMQNSISVTFNTPGTYYFFASYTETTKPYTTAISTCEKLVVSPAISTPVYPFGDIIAVLAPLGALLTYALYASRQHRRVVL